MGKNVKENKEIKTTFEKLIEILTNILKLDSYKISYEDYNDLLKTILKWNKSYIVTKDLSLINHTQLLKVYNRIDDLSNKYIFNSTIGKESELADEAVIWIWELMKLRKNQIDRKEENKNG